MTRIDKIKTLINELITMYKNGEFENDKEYKLELVKFSEKTAKQLALYNATLRDIQEKTSQSLMLTRDEIHNTLLGELGYLQYDKEGSPKTELHKLDYPYLKDNETHLKPTNTMVEGQNGVKMKVFYVLKESKDFTTKEFSKLIDRLITFIIDNDLRDKIDISHLQDMIKE